MKSHQTPIFFLLHLLLLGTPMLCARTTGDFTPVMRQGTVIIEGASVRTTTARSALEFSLPGRGVMRLAGVAQAQTGSTLRFEAGQALLSSGRGPLGRRGLRSDVGPVDLTLRGTVLISAQPQEPIKITVLEGYATARLKSRRSHFAELRAGTMLMVSDGDLDMPAATEVRLERLRSTSGLLRRPFGPLPTDGAIDTAVTRQEGELGRQRLIASNVRVRGSQATLAAGSTDEGSTTTQSGTSSSGNTGSATSGSASTSSSTGTSNTSSTGTFSCVGCASRATPTGAVAANDPNRLAQIRAENADSGVTGGRSGQTVAGGKVSSTVSVSNSGSRGDLDLAPPAGSTISVRNSSDLNALAQSVILASFGESISVETSTFSRLPGIINIDAGTIFERTLSLQQSTFSADVIKARGFQGAGQDALVIDGSAFNAAQIVRLYAEGGGTLRFRGNVTLNTPQADLAGSVVQIDGGGRVQATGVVRVSSDAHRYDAPGFGTLEAAGGKTAVPFAARPRY